MSPATRRTLLLSLPLAGLVAMIAWPSFVARIQYARTRAEIAAIRDAALGAELAPVGKLFTTLARVIGPAVVNVTAKRRVVTLAHEIEALAGGAGTTGGSGGMASKLAAARIAAWSGVRTVIAAAHRDDVVADAIADVPGVGTVVRPHERDLPARKLWIAFAVGSRGRVTVDAGARRALERGGTSLLAAGVIAVEGDFDGGDAVEIVDPEGSVFAKGLVRCGTDELTRIAGRTSVELGTETDPHVVHVDDLVIVG